MTLQQLKYVITVAETGTITEAANKLYISQPSLTNAIHELEQAAILEDKYKHTPGGKKNFCVSTQHYSFAVNAFVDLIKKYGQDDYDQ